MIIKKALLTMVGVAVVSATPITTSIISLQNTANEIIKDQANEDGIDGSIFDAPSDFRTLESLTTDDDENQEWTPNPKKINWGSLIDPKMEWNYARKYGWTDINLWRMYTQYAREKQSPDVHSTFGAFSTPPGDGWLAWHHAQGGTLSTSYSDGTGSSIRPSWDLAHLEAANNINNNLQWFLYDRGGSIFAFNEHNIENAWKRLVHMERIVRTSISEIRIEEGKNSKEEDAESVMRNYVMVNGRLRKVADLNANENYYYVRDNATEDWVRDSNGWKVVITDENVYNSLTSVINPENYSVYAGVTGEADPRPFKDLNYKKYTVSTQATFATAIDSKRHKILNYPLDYTVNAEFALVKDNIVTTSGFLSDGTKTISFKDAVDKNLWSGLYSIVLAKDSFVELVQDQNTILPQEMFPTGDKFVTRYGAAGPWTYSHPWNGGGYNFLWIEDGKGGHKVWKDIENLRIKGYENEGGRQRPVGSATYPSNAGVEIRNNWKIYGNHQYIWPGTEKGREWFEEQTERYNDMGWI